MVVARGKKKEKEVPNAPEITTENEKSAETPAAELIFSEQPAGPAVNAAPEPKPEEKEELAERKEPDRNIQEKTRAEEIILDLVKKVIQNIPAGAQGQFAKDMCAEFTPKLLAVEKCEMPGPHGKNEQFEATACRCIKRRKDEGGEYYTPALYLVKLEGRAPKVVCIFCLGELKRAAREKHMRYEVRSLEEIVIEEIGEEIRYRSGASRRAEMLDAFQEETWEVSCSWRNGCGKKAKLPFPPDPKKHYLCAEHHAEAKKMRESRNRG